MTITKKLPQNNHFQKYQCQHVSIRQGA